MRNVTTAALGTLLLVGCGQTPGNVAISSSVSDPLAAGSGMTSTFQPAAGSLSWLSFSTEASQPLDLVPGQTQAKADEIAHQWAPDSQQVAVAWGFAVISLLGETQHVYYAPSVGKVLDVQFQLTPWFPSQKVIAVPAFGLATKVLRTVADDHRFTAQDAYGKAEDAGYRSNGLVAAAVLVNPLLYGPQWIFLDSPTHRYPEVSVSADTGAASTGGIELSLLRLLFTNRGQSQAIGSQAAGG